MSNPPEIICSSLPCDGVHSVTDRMPTPGVFLHVWCESGQDGDATYAEDGKWYWASNRIPLYTIPFTVTHWSYI